MARIKVPKYKGPKRLVASIRINVKAAPKKVNKFLYAIYHRVDGTSVKRRCLNPEYVAKK
jgi:hypothetical protein